jgi:hypothetical protein
MRKWGIVITASYAFILPVLLELAIAVPAHMVARRHNDGSAPTVTGFGIATAVAMMLLSFGPGVLLLYKKRLDDYASRKPATAARPE